MKVDLHVHTIYSPDCLTAPEGVLSWARRRGLGAVAITDHNEIAGALALCEIADLPIIVGEEVTTRQGEVIGLFIHERIPAGLSAVETAQHIREQGGLVYLPHPFDRLRSSALGAAALPDILPFVDAVEGLNARVLLPQDNARAIAWAAQQGLPLGAGSDAHHKREIGRAYVDMAPFGDAASFMESLRGGCLGGGISSPLVHFYSSWARFYKHRPLVQR
ncbi:MAG: PHP domain-containing protein [Chloroflexi bacterium]|nr:PHP domain-containing protein [Chloroflexota bacterium]